MGTSLRSTDFVSKPKNIIRQETHVRFADLVLLLNIILTHSNYLLS